VIPHTFGWYKGENQERNQIGFDEDDNDGGLAGTYSRINPRLYNEPRECNCVFVRKLNWLKFYNINNGNHIVCPGCKIRVG